MTAYRRGDQESGLPDLHVWNFPRVSSNLAVGDSDQEPGRLVRDAKGVGEQVNSLIFRERRKRREMARPGRLGFGDAGGAAYSAHTIHPFRLAPGDMSPAVVQAQRRTESHPVG